MLPLPEFGGNRGLLMRRRPRASPTAQADCPATALHDASLDPGRYGRFYRRDL